METKSSSLAVALVIAFATYLVAQHLLDASSILAVAIATATFLVVQGGALTTGRSPRRSR